MKHGKLPTKFPGLKSYNLGGPSGQQCRKSPGKARFSHLQKAPEQTMSSEPQERQQLQLQEQIFQSLFLPNLKGSKGSRLRENLFEGWKCCQNVGPKNCLFRKAKRPRKHSNRRTPCNKNDTENHKAASSRPVVIDLISSPCNISSENEAIDSTPEMQPKSRPKKRWFGLHQLTAVTIG